MMKKLILPIFLLIYTVGVAQDTITIIEKLDLINSKSDELMPVFSNDGQTMYFTRGFHPDNTGGEKAGQDIWYSKLQKDSTWGSPERFDAPLNNEQDNSVCGVSNDGKTLYLDNIYDKKKRMHPGLSSSKLDDKGKWEAPKAVTIDGFKPKPPFLEFSFPESNDGIMIISMDNDDSTKKEDLYFSRRNGDSWSKPVYMGNTLNTSGFEIAPFLARDGKTLYFASNGLGGEGDCDIFKSTRLDDSWVNWSKPENLGSNINSSGFDAYYTIDPMGREYFVRGNLSDGDDNIYIIKYEYPEIIEVPDTASVDTVVAIIEPIVKDTQVVVIKDTTQLISASPFKEKFTVYFEYDKSDVNGVKQNQEVIQDVLKALKNDPERNVTITGHTCDKGGSVYNQKLSERRTIAVMQYLIEKGINKSRIKSESKGLTEPKVSNDSDVNRSKNRRAEIMVFD